MSFELLYTSAPKGIKTGSRGFCTVLATASMPANLMQRLEALCAYRHVFQPHQPGTNPVTFAHYKLNVSGVQYDVLSRVSDYGTDYSGRTNKIAHHIALTTDETPSGGPTYALFQTNSLRTTWDGPPQSLPQGPALAGGQLEAGPCSTWQQLTGDAGWAGVLAETWLESGSKICWVVFDLTKSDYLNQLVQEAAALLPAERRWQATFSTYATNVPPDAECQVRFVLAETEEARHAPARGRVIDLTRKIAEAPKSRYVEAARLGQAIAEPRKPTAPAASSSSSTASPSSPPAKPKPKREVATRNVGDEDIELALAGLEPASASPPAWTATPPEYQPAPRAKPKLVNDAAPNFDANQSARWIIIGAGTFCALLMLAVGAFVLSRLLPPPTAQQPTQQQQQQQQQPTAQDEPDKKPPAQAEEVKPALQSSHIVLEQPIQADSKGLVITDELNQRLTKLRGEGWTYLGSLPYKLDLKPEGTKWTGMLNESLQSIPTQSQLTLVHSKANDRQTTTITLSAPPAADKALPESTSPEKPAGQPLASDAVAKPPLPFKVNNASITVPAELSAPLTGDLFRECVVAEGEGAIEKLQLQMVAVTFQGSADAPVKEFPVERDLPQIGKLTLEKNGKFTLTNPPAVAGSVKPVVEALIEFVAGPEGAKPEQATVSFTRTIVDKPFAKSEISLAKFLDSGFTKGIDVQTVHNCNGIAGATLGGRKLTQVNTNVAEIGDAVTERITFEKKSDHLAFKIFINEKKRAKYDDRNSPFVNFRISDNSQKAFANFSQLDRDAAQFLSSPEGLKYIPKPDSRFELKYESTWSNELAKQREPKSMKKLDAMLALMDSVVIFQALDGIGLQFKAELDKPIKDRQPGFPSSLDISGHKKTLQSFIDARWPSKSESTSSLDSLARDYCRLYAVPQTSNRTFNDAILDVIINNNRRRPPFTEMKAPLRNLGNLIVQLHNQPVILVSNEPFVDGEKGEQAEPPKYPLDFEFRVSISDDILERIKTFLKFTQDAAAPVANAITPAPPSATPPTAAPAPVPAVQPGAAVAAPLDPTK